MLVRVHHEQIAKPGRVFYRPKLLSFESTLGHIFQPDHIRRRHDVDDSGKQIRPLGCSASDSDAASGTAVDEQPALRRDVPPDELFAAADQVFPGVVLVRVFATQAPGIAKLPAAANMADRVGSTFPQKAVTPSACVTIGCHARESRTWSVGET